MKIKKLHPDAKMPTYATDGSGCFDLYSCGHDCCTVGFPCSFRTGLAFEVPSGHVMLIFSRSGHGFNFGVRLANAVGCVDADYWGEVMVKLANDHKGDALFLSAGDRIAQALVIPVERYSFEWTDELSETARGKGGFGSTGA